MTPFPSRRLAPTLLLSALLLAGLALSAQAQSGSRSLRPMSMGGGTASLGQGTAALYSNPANLTTGEQEHRLEVRLLDVRLQAGGSLLQFNHYNDTFTTGQALSSDQVTSTLDAWFGREQRTTVAHLSVVPVAATYRPDGANWAAGGGLRVRTTATSGLNRGLFDLLLRGTGQTRSIPIDGRYRAYSTLDLTGAFSYRFESLGLSVGAAPRLIFGMGFADGTLTSTLDVQEQSLVHTFDYTARAAGAPSTSIYDTFNAFDDDPLGGTSSSGASPAGYGAGLDVGGTYSVRPDLQVSLSVTDLGFVQWTREAQTVTPDNNAFRFDGVSLDVDRLNDEFDGDVGAYVEHKVDSLARGAYEDVTRSRESFATGLPTALHLGSVWTLLDGSAAVNAGISAGLNDRAGAVAATPVLHVGGEYELGPVPVRAGARVFGSRAATLSFGTGLHLGGYAFDLGASVTPSSSTLGAGARYAVGFSLATMRF
jgi:hypothetical protein